MRAFILAVLMVGYVVPTQDTWHREHPEPPRNWFCSREAKDEHHCECTVMAHPEKLCEDPQESANCKVYCWATAQRHPPDDTHPTEWFSTDHCRCPIKCEKGEHDATAK